MGVRGKGLEGNIKQSLFGGEGQGIRGDINEPQLL